MSRGNAGSAVPPASHTMPGDNPPKPTPPIIFTPLPAGLPILLVPHLPQKPIPLIILPKIIFTPLPAGLPIFLISHLPQKAILLIILPEIILPILPVPHFPQKPTPPIILPKIIFTPLPAGLPILLIPHLPQKAILLIILPILRTALPSPSVCNPSSNGNSKPKPTGSAFPFPN